MSKRSKYSAQEKYEILMEYEHGNISRSKIASIYEINEGTLNQWSYSYRNNGLDGLKESRSCKKYSKEIKEKAVADYLSGKYSQRDIVRKYQISAKRVLEEWIKKYNSHRESKSTPKGMSISMTKGRTTSWKEKIEIVLYCIAHNKDYQDTTEIHNVSYQQVYQWVQKYEFGGEDALKDRRGRKKDEEELTPEDRINLEMKKLKAENERLRAENAFLKKLEELERSRS